MFDRLRAAGRADGFQTDSSASFRTGGTGWPSQKPMLKGIHSISSLIIKRYVMVRNSSQHNSEDYSFDFQEYLHKRGQPDHPTER